MVWTMCSLENLQVKVLSGVVVVFTRPNAFMYKPICKVKQFAKTYSHFKNIHGVFYYEIVAFFQILLVHIPEVMKTELANLLFCVTFQHFSCLILACLLCCSRLISGFFCCFLVRDLCRSGCGHDHPPPPPPLTRHVSMFLPLPTVLSLIQMTVIRNQCCLKLVSVPLSRLLLYIGHLKKSFPW